MPVLSGAQPSTWTDDRLEIVIGNLLRIGVTIAAVVVLAGGILYLAKHGSLPVDYGSFHGEPRELRSISGIIRAAPSGNPRAIIQLGLLLLIATPVARVIFSAFGFLRERDYRYVLITLIVLGVLLYSILKSG
ncbi:MAG: DUF1634 domain-containing protein [Terriglobales bacterium]